MQFKRCTVPNCTNKRKYALYCGMHYQRVSAGQPVGEATARKKPAGYGHVNSAGYKEFDEGHEHVLIAERVLGRTLPIGAVVHHADENRSNNAPNNLVICPNQAYHMLLHQRMRALAACGNANWMKCVFCKRYDDPDRLYIRPNRHQGFHRACSAKDKVERRHAQM